MTENRAATVNLRKFARPKRVQRKNSRTNDLEMQPIPSLTNQNDQKSTTADQPQNNHQKNPNLRSTAENFKQIYTETSFPASYSGNINEIANQIPSYRYG